MKKTILFCLHHPVAVVMVVSAVGIFGSVSGARIETDFLPRVESRRILVSAAYPGLPAEEIRDTITIPLEDALSSVGGIKKMTSVSRQGSSVIELEFQWKTNMKRAATETREVIDLAYTSLPSRTKKPTVLPGRGADEAVLMIGIFPRRLESSGRDLELVRRLCSREIRTRLQRVEGVGTVSVKGGWTDEVKVLVDGAKAANRGLSLSYLSEMIRRSNADYAAGTLVDGETEYLVKTGGKVKHITGLASLPVILPEKRGAILLKDIALIRTGSGEQESYFAGNAGEGIGIFIHRHEGCSPAVLSGNVRKEVRELKKTYGEQVRIDILKDTSGQIGRSVRKLLLSAVIGCCIALGTVFLFLKKISYAALLALNFPVSIFFCLIGLQIFGKTLNLMSIGGLVIGVGMLVDNGIVVLENLQRRVPKTAQDESARRQIAEAAAEMALPALGATCTTLIVFLPVLLMPDMIGVIYADLAYSVILSLAGSYFCSTIVIPVCYLFLQRRYFLPAGPSEKTQKGTGRIEGIYSRLLARVLGTPVTILPIIFAVLGVGGAGAFFVSFRLFPPVSTGECEITIPLEPGISMERIKEAGSFLQAFLEASDYVTDYFLYAGGGGDDVHYLSDPNERRGIIHCTVFLSVDKGPGEQEIREQILHKLSAMFPEVYVKTPHPLTAPLLGIDEDFLSITVLGTETEKAEQTAERLITGIMDTDPGYSREDFSIFPERTKPEIRLLPYRDKLSSAGLSLDALTREISIALKGSTPAKVRIMERDLDVRLQLAKGGKLSVEELKELILLTPRGRPAVLDDLADIQLMKSPTAVLRENRKDTVHVRMPGANWSSLPNADQIQGLIRETEGAFTAGSSLLEEQKHTIIILFILACVLIYLLLGAQFESVVLPFLIVLPVLPAFSGVLAALALTGNSLDLNSALGIIVFLGIGVNNSIILAEIYRKNIQPGDDVLPVIRHGSVKRIRPILMTMLTTITALIPTAIDPLNRSGQSGMAAAIIGGLTAAGIITLFIQPVFFLFFFRRASRPVKRQE